jgi:integral membrane protein
MSARPSKNFIKRFRIIGQMEGASFLILLGIAMPMKYLLDIPEPVKMIGWAHGLLFILYLIGVAQAKFTLNWSLKQVFFALIASVVPFGPFIIDRQYLKDAEAGKAGR